MIDFCFPMPENYSFLFHQSSKSRQGQPIIPKNDAQWPIEWKTTYYKAYPRLPKIHFQVNKPEADLFDVIQKRTSTRDFTRDPLDLDELGTLLKYSCGNTLINEDGTKMRRAQPSGGARFPIEVYPLIFQETAGIKPGVYHYNVKMHTLDVLWERKFSGEDIDILFTYDWCKQASCAFIMTGVFERNQMKYGERGYRMILIEAGHIGQNLSLVSEALHIKCCGLSGTRDENIEKLLDIDGIQESVVYAYIFGH